MITAARLRAVVSADTGQAQKNLKEFGGTVDDVAKQTVKGVGGIRDTFNSLPGPLAKLAGYLSVGAVVGFGVEVAKAAVSMDNQRQIAENMRRELEAYAGGASQAMAATQALTRATEGSITQLDAMRGASQLLSMGLVQNADEAYNMARMAVMLGDKTQSATDRMASWNTMLGNQSIERLDSFGISSSRVRQRIDEQMEATAGLSRETAFVTAVMEIGAGRLAELEAAGVSATTSVGQLSVAFSDLKQALAGEVEASGFVDWLTGMARGAERIISGKDAAWDTQQAAVKKYFDAQQKVIDAQAALETAQTSPVFALTRKASVERYQGLLNEAQAGMEVARVEADRAVKLSQIAEGTYIAADAEKEYTAALAGRQAAEKVAADKQAQDAAAKEIDAAKKIAAAAAQRANEVSTETRQAMGLDVAGAGFVLSEADAAKMAQAFQTGVTDALGALKPTMGATIIGEMLASLQAEIAGDDALEGQGAAAFHKVGKGWVDAATNSPYFQRAISAMVGAALEQALAD